MPLNIRCATIIVNPIARGVTRRFDSAAAVRYLRHRGLEVELAAPATSTEATAVARRAAEKGADLVFVVGGDGSLRAAAAGLIGTPAALAAVPSGTANVWAKETGIPSRPRAAIDTHLAGQIVPMDVGFANNQPFLLMAGIGWDARIAGRVSTRLKRRFGAAAYAVETLRELPALRPITARWRTGETAHEERLALMIVGNTRLYGGLVEFTPDAVATDGQLDVAAIYPRGPADLVRLSGRLLVKRLEDGSAFLAERVPELEFLTGGFPVQLDGDTVLQTPARFHVEHLALRVSIPAGPRPLILPRPDGGPESTR